MVGRQGITGSFKGDTTLFCLYHNKKQTKDTTHTINIKY